MENELKEPGICAYCEEQSDRLFEPPLIQPDNWSEVEVRGGHGAWWGVPGRPYRHKDLFHIVEVGGVNYLRPYETPDEPICWGCFDGHVSPSWLSYCVNKPTQIQFNGWKQPEWVGA